MIERTHFAVALCFKHLKLKHKTMDVNLSLKLSKAVHEICKDVPHDIGITLEQIVREHQNEQFNKHSVSGKRPFEIEQIIQKHDRNEITMAWALAEIKAACDSGAVDKTVSVCECSISTTQGQCMGLVNCRHYHPGA